AFRSLHSAHDEAVMTARRFRKTQLGQLLLENGFAIRRLTYWTTLLFPVAVLARTLNWSKTRRDIPEAGTSSGFTSRLFGKVMALELRWLRKFALPFGVDLFAAAEKQPSRLAK